jgi:hypothetical protein
VFFYRMSRFLYVSVVVVIMILALYFIQCSATIGQVISLEKCRLVRGE